MTDATSATPLNAMTPVKVRLGDLGLAPENVRFKEPADAAVPQLAETILAAGLVIPPIVRPGRKGEPAFMALDGRRRRFALLLLRDRGDLTDDHEIDCLLAETKAQQAAGLMLPATEHAPVHIADVIAAIGKLRRSKMDSRAISAALGYAELEIKRLEALAAVHPKVLDALRLGRLTLKQVRLFARLTDKARQAEIAQTALDGHFQDYHLRSLLDRDRATAEDERLRLVGLDRYLAAGGRVSADLFGELPDSLLDPEILQDVWRARIEPIVAALESAGLSVLVGQDAGWRAPLGFSALPYVYPGDLTPSRAQALSTARARVVEIAGELQALDTQAEDAPDRLVPLLCAMLQAAGAPLTYSRIGAVLLTPGDTHGVSATFYCEPLPTDQLPAEADLEDDEDVAATRSRFGGSGTDVEVPQVEVELEACSHRLHQTRTDIATRGLIRDLADDPGAALTVLVAQLFKALALQGCGGLEASAAAISATAYAHGSAPGVPALDGEIRGRLADRRAAYQASGLRPIPWVETLAHGDKMALMAELTAVSLDLREPRTTAIRPAARAEAAEIAALCGADIAAHWTPDEAYLSVHSKAQLWTLMAEMGVEDARAGSLKKADLVAFVAEAAAERQFAPAVLAWDRPGVSTASVTEVEDGPHDAVGGALAPADAPDAEPIAA